MNIHLEFEKKPQGISNLQKLTNITNITKVRKITEYNTFIN